MSRRVVPYENKSERWKAVVSSAACWVQRRGLALNICSSKEFVDLLRTLDKKSKAIYPTTLIAEIKAQSIKKLKPVRELVGGT